MNRRDFVFSGVFSGLLAGAACSRGPRLNVYNWSDYIAPDTVANFERESGVRVRYGTYESNQEMLAQVMSGNSGWDVVFPSEEFIGPMRELGLLAPLRHEWLPNLSALYPEFQHPPWDPELKWSVPYMHGCSGVLYRKGIPVEPRSWADLWDRRLSGKITMLDDETEVFGACLKKIGFPLASGDDRQLRAAQREAIAQKPLVRAYVNAEVRDQVVAGDVWAAQAWAVTAGQAIAAAPNALAFSLPAEGFGRYADNICILRESRRMEAAHQWVNYILRPQVAASIVMAVRVASASRGAEEFLPGDITANPVLYPSRETLDRAEWFTSQPLAAQRLRDRLWTEIKSS